jgi:hypothetical protein
MPEVREALRALPHSTLVGTAVGRSLLKDGLHYTNTTYAAAGRMFAGAISSQFYGVTRSSYPPLEPEPTGYIDSTNGSSYFVRLKWQRGSTAATALRFLTSDQAFALRRDFVQLYDTSQVWSKIDPDDPGSVLVGLRGGSVEPHHAWTLSYLTNSGADRAPLAQIIGPEEDTLFGVGFLDLPVLTLDSLPPRLVRDLTDLQLFPTPTRSALTILVRSTRSQTVTLELCDITGRLLRTSTEQLLPGWNHLNLSLAELPVQTCLITVSSANTVLARKLLLVH